jgi:hypothetical protein
VRRARRAKGRDDDRTPTEAIAMTSTGREVAWVAPEVGLFARETTHEPEQTTVKSLVPENVS